MNAMPPIAIVTGASRGAGRGIAVALGKHGCTVYVTGRSQQSGDHTLPGTIHETAAAVTAVGGLGIAIACDHSDDDQVRALFKQVMTEQGRIDILINNAAAIQDELSQPGAFWEKPLKLDRIIDVGLRSSYVASWHAAPIMVAQDSGLIVFTSSSGAAHYCMGPAYGAQKAGLGKMAFDMASDFRHANVNVSALAIWMGPLMTERLKAMIAAEPEKYGPLSDHCETPEFTGHVIWALYTDPKLAARNGKTIVGAEIARNYGITDEGRIPLTTQELYGVSPSEFHAAEIR